MTMSIGKVCSVCGALIITGSVNGAPIETCQRDSVSLCPEPRIESSHIHTHGPESALIERFTPAAHRLGPMQGVGIASSAFIGALRMIGPNGTDVTESCRSA